MSGPDITGALIHRFQREIAERHGEAQIAVSHSVELIEDRTGYALRPHTDTFQKLVTVLVYLADRGAPETLGTSVYVPRDRKALPQTFATNARLPREMFAIATTIPYRPNTAFVFAPGNATFHGVEPVATGTVRRLVQFQINHAQAK